MGYGDSTFQNGYLVAYFPYYIEPIYHVLKQAELSEKLLAKKNLRISFFGGGPCPEALGVSAYLKEEAPNLQEVKISIFDREKNWNSIHQEFLAKMIPDFSGEVRYSIQSRSCNLSACTPNMCSSSQSSVGSDLVVAQNFLSELQSNSEQAIEAFEGIVRRSRCQYLVFVENNYQENKGLLRLINQRLHEKGLSCGLAEINKNIIRPNIALPDILQHNLYTGEDKLIAKRNVKYHSMVIEIERANI
jgi:hypothetical protein